MERLTVDQRQDAGAKVLHCLQAAFYADPSGMAALVANRVPINAVLAEHPHLYKPGDKVNIDLAHVPEASPARFTLGLMGLLNMLFSPLEIPPLALLHVYRKLDEDHLDEEATYLEEGEEEAGIPVEVICAGFGVTIDRDSTHAAEAADLIVGSAVQEDDDRTMDLIPAPELPEFPPWTEEQKEDAFKRILALLQSCWEADPGAIYTLCSNRVTTTQAVVDHPYIICEPMPIPGDEPRPMLGVLGVINGALGCLGLPLLASRWEDCEKGSLHPRKMLGFQRFTGS